MTRALPFAAALLSSIALGCGDPATPSSDAGPSGGDAPTASVDAPIAPGTDAPLPDGAVVPTPDGGGTCDPSGGPAMGDAYCDLFELAIFTFDDATPEARLYGRLTPEGVTEGGCAVVDEVEVQHGGAAIGTLAGAGAFIAGSESALLGSGPPLAEMTTRCEDDTERFGGWGFIVRGRVDGGTFEAHCADAEGGGRWPPAVRTTCHHGVTERPVASYGMVSNSAMFDSTMLSTYLPHPSSPPATTVSGTVHVIPGFAPAIFGPPPPMLDPFDATFGASLFESTLPGTGTPTTQVSLFASEVLLPIEICPGPSTGPPDPGDPLPPVFLVRLTGTTATGAAISTEAYVNSCYTTSS